MSVLLSFAAFVSGFICGIGFMFFIAGYVQLRKQRQHQALIKDIVSQFRDSRKINGGAEA